VKVDAVEIDEKVVQFAEKYFDVRTQKNTNIITDDAFKYLKSDKNSLRRDLHGRLPQAFGKNRRDGPSFGLEDRRVLQGTPRASHAPRASSSSI